MSLRTEGGRIHLVFSTKFSLAREIGKPIQYKTDISLWRAVRVVHSAIVLVQRLLPQRGESMSAQPEGLGTDPESQKVCRTEIC